MSPSDVVRSFYKRGGAAPNELTKGAPEKIESKPGFLMTAEDKIRARDERINPKKIIPAGTPEKIESKKENISSDNDAIISILNKILASFQADNERMRRSIRDAAEKKLESDPTPDTPGAPVREGDDKKSGMNKLLMFGAIAGLLIAAYKFKDEIAEILKHITNTLEIPNPLKGSDEGDYKFDIMDALGVTALLGILGIGAGARARAGAGAGGAAGTGRTGRGKSGSARGTYKDTGDAIRAFRQRGGAAPGGPTKIVKGAGHARAVAVGLGPLLTIASTMIGYDALLKELDQAEQEHADGKINDEEYKEIVGHSWGSFIGGTAGTIAGMALGGAVGAAFGLPLAGVGSFVTGSIGGVLGFFAGAAVGEYFGPILGARMANLPDPKPKAPTPLTFDESVQNELKTSLENREVINQIQSMPGGFSVLGTLRELSTVDLKRGGMFARAAPKRFQNVGNEFAKALQNIKDEQYLQKREDSRQEALNQILTGLTEEEKEKALQDYRAGERSSSTPSAAAAPAGGVPAGGVPAGDVPAAGGAAPRAAGAPTSTGVAKGDMPVGSPVPSAPPPASETSGSAITSATMESSAAQNTITVLPPVINNQTNTSSSNPARESKANKITMQIRMDDEMFRTAVNATAAVLKTLKAA